MIYLTSLDSLRVRPQHLLHREHLHGRQWLLRTVNVLRLRIDAAAIGDQANRLVLDGQRFDGFFQNGSTGNLVDQSGGESRPSHLFCRNEIKNETPRGEGEGAENDDEGDTDAERWHWCTSRGSGSRGSGSGSDHESPGACGVSGSDEGGDGACAWSAAEAAAAAECCAVPAVRSAELGGTSGPLRRVLSAPFAVIYGSGGALSTSTAATATVTDTVDDTMAAAAAVATVAAGTREHYRQQAAERYRRAAVAFASDWYAVGPLRCG